MSSLPTKALISLWCLIVSYGGVFALAQSSSTTTTSSTLLISSWATTSLKTLSQDRQRVLNQRISNLQDSLLRGSGSGAEYRDMVSILQCLQIPFMDSNQISLTLLQKIADDMARDRQSIDSDIAVLLSVSSTDVRVSVMRQLIESTAQKYTNTLDALARSIESEQTHTIQWIDRLITSNKTLFRQLLADKKLIDSMILSSTQRQQKIASQKTSLGFTKAQMDAIIADYRTTMTSYVASWLQIRADRLVKQYKDIIPLPAFVQSEKNDFITAYGHQINDRFAQRLGDASTGSSYIQRLNETVSLMQKQFYQWSGLQCGLLTTMTQAQRNNYTSIVADLNESMASLATSTTQSSWAITLSTWFVNSLNDRYLSSSKAIFAWFTASVQDQAALWKKAIRSERVQVNALQNRLIEYRQFSSLPSSSAIVKKTRREEILHIVAQIQKEWVLSVLSQKTLDRISKELSNQK